MIKIPILSEYELKELGEIMYSKKKDDLLKRRFWNKVYRKRGLKYKQLKE